MLALDYNNISFNNRSIAKGGGAAIESIGSNIINNTTMKIAPLEDEEVPYVLSFQFRYQRRNQQRNEEQQEAQEQQRQQEHQRDKPFDATAPKTDHNAATNSNNENNNNVIHSFLSILESFVTQRPSRLFQEEEDQSRNDSLIEQRMTQEERKENLNHIRNIKNKVLPDLHMKKYHIGWVEANNYMQKLIDRDPWFGLNDRLRNIIQTNPHDQEKQLTYLNILIDKIHGPPPGIQSHPSRGYVDYSEIYGIDFSRRRHQQSFTEGDVTQGKGNDTNATTNFTTDIASVNKCNRMNILEPELPAGCYHRNTDCNDNINNSTQHQNRNDSNNDGTTAKHYHSEANTTGSSSQEGKWHVIILNEQQKKKQESEKEERNDKEQKERQGKNLSIKKTKHDEINVANDKVAIKAVGRNNSSNNNNYDQKELKMVQLLTSPLNSSEQQQLADPLSVIAIMKSDSKSTSCDDDGNGCYNEEEIDTNNDKGTIGKRIQQSIIATSSNLTPPQTQPPTATTDSTPSTRQVDNITNLEAEDKKAASNKKVDETSKDTANIIIRTPDKKEQQNRLSNTSADRKTDEVPKSLSKIFMEHAITASMIHDNRGINVDRENNGNSSENAIIDTKEDEPNSSNSSSRIYDESNNNKKSSPCNGDSNDGDVSSMYSNNSSSTFTGAFIEEEEAEATIKPTLQTEQLQQAHRLTARKRTNTKRLKRIERDDSLDDTYNGEYANKDLGMFPHDNAALHKQKQQIEEKYEAIQYKQSEQSQQPVRNREFIHENDEQNNYISPPKENEKKIRNQQSDFDHFISSFRGYHQNAAVTLVQPPSFSSTNVLPATITIKTPPPERSPVLLLNEEGMTAEAAQQYTSPVDIDEEVENKRIDAILQNLSPVVNRVSNESLYTTKKTPKTSNLRVDTTAWIGSDNNKEAPPPPQVPHLGRNDIMDRPLDKIITTLPTSYDGDVPFYTMVASISSHNHNNEDDPSYYCSIEENDDDSESGFSSLTSVLSGKKKMSSSASRIGDSVIGKEFGPDAKSDDHSGIYSNNVMLNIAIKKDVARLKDAKQKIINAFAGSSELSKSSSDLCKNLDLTKFAQDSFTVTEDIANNNSNITKGTNSEYRSTDNNDYLSILEDQESSQDGDVPFLTLNCDNELSDAEISSVTFFLSTLPTTGVTRRGSHFNHYQSNDQKFVLVSKPPKKVETIRKR